MNNKISDILDCTPGYIYWKDTNGVYLGCNQAEAEMLGFKSPKEIIGKTDYDLLWGDKAEVLIETDRRIMKNKETEEIVEYITSSNGKPLTVLTRKKPLYDDENNVIGVIGVSVDITSRKAKEGKESELKMQQYINNILQYVPVCIYWKDTNGVYLGCNKAEAEVLGFKSAKEVVGKTDYDLSWKYEAEILRETDQRIIKSRSAEEILEKVTGSDGKEIVMLTKKSPLYDDKDNVIGVIGISIDITDRKEKEALEMKLKLQEGLYRIAREVAHDIHSPLTALEAFQYLVKSKLTEDERKILDSLKRSINNITSKLMEKYKEIKEGESKGKAYVRNTESEKKEGIIDVNLSMREVLEGKVYEYSNKNVEIKYEEKEKEVFIKGDTTDFERMMSNIINNGIEAVEGKKAEIGISCEVKGKEVEIRVKDNGKGMPKEMVKKLEKWGEIGTTKSDGHGIGTQQIMGTVKAMEWKIEINSKEGEGTEFVLIFPKAEGPNIQA
ncbi:MAG: PAS domain-containing protein [Endomicrobium sp.]|jgi:PAS domain S-box-containing protein|nr:PAS domain-containing protein [Endomicrobium sp.]